jgi:teichuronic acid biosynthesis glycosyltransferase TuaC
VRALVVSDMQADASHPERGRFVRDQVAALRELGGVELELFEFPPGPRALARAGRALRARFRSSGGRRAGAPAAKPDVVHSHFGLTAWPAFAVPATVRALTVHGTDVRHPRTRLLTAGVLPRMDIVAAASKPLVAELPLRSARERALVLPCGVDMRRFVPIPRVVARRELGLDAGTPYLLFPADPARAEKRHDRAAELAAATGASLLTLGGVAPEQVPLWVNAVNAVLVPSEREGFGLAVLEALACDVPVLATPVGVHREALDGVAGTLCEQWDLVRWRAAVEPHLRAADPRVAGRASAEPFSATRMAEWVLAAWRSALDSSRKRGG